MPRTAFTRVFIVASLASACWSQSLQLIPDISLAEAEYRDATQAWISNDPYLERDLTKGNPEEMRRRVRRAAALADDLMVKKIAYIDALAQRVEDTRRRVSQASGGAIPTEALKKDLADQQTRILDEETRLEALLNDLPPGDEYLFVRGPLEEERTDLVKLQNTIALRLRSLDSLDKAQQAIQSAGAGGLQQRIDEIARIWSEQKASAVRQRTRFASLYASEERAISGKSVPTDSPLPPPAAPTPSKSRDPDRRRNAPVVSAKTAVLQGPTFEGAWMYQSQPGAWTGIGEPEMVSLQLRQQGEVLRGTYTARLPSRGGVHEVFLALEGRRESATVARLHWMSSTPAADGEIELKLGGDGRLLLERTKSADGFIPLGMEVLLRQ